VYLRETRRRNKDGSVVRYLQLARSERHPESGCPVARIIHNFGRAESVDREALRRRLRTRCLLLRTSASPRPCARRRRSAASTLTLWSASASRSSRSGHWSRAPSWPPRSWVAERVAIEHCPRFDEGAASAAMDFLAAALPEIAAAIFARTANLLNLACGVIFVVASSTYFEIDLAAEAEGRAAAALGEAEGGPSEAASRRFNRHSKDKRPDQPQVVIGVAVTGESIPVRCSDLPRQRLRSAHHPHDP
jgi:hypothetical protein